MKKDLGHYLLKMAAFLIATSDFCVANAERLIRLVERMDIEKAAKKKPDDSMGA
ncbi:TPA: hypothetical protein LU109_003552 [Enterobacter hormaechei subsp. xiangfangensis]|nr:hypothetical protein [Enterobacter hormaechei subsp. xiangfangensis]